MRCAWCTHVDREGRSSTRLAGQGGKPALAILLTAILLSHATSSPGAAPGSCTDYSRYIHLVGSANTPGSARAVELAGTGAYVADASGGVHIFDISYPPSPTLRGSFDTPGTAYDLVVAGGLAYVADGAAGVQILDVSVSEAPWLVASYDTPGSARGLVFRAPFLYVADESAGLQILDATNPAAPTLVGSLDSPGTCRGAIVLHADYIYLGDGYYQHAFAENLDVIDIRNPATPILVSTLDTDGEPWSIAIHENRAYVASWPETYFRGFEILDLTNPASPTRIGSMSAYFIAVEPMGSMALFGGGSGIWVVDLSDPSQPLPLVGAATSGIVFDIRLDADLAYLAAGSAGLQLLDLSTPAIAPVLHSIPLVGGQIAVQSATAYVAGFGAGLHVLERSDPLAPSLLATFDTDGNAVDVVADGNRVLVAAEDEGLLIVDVTNPCIPALLGSIDTPGIAQRVALAGSYAYVADAYSGVQVIDVSNSSQPMLAGGLVTGGTGADIALYGPFAYLADGQVVEILNLSVPTAPTLAGSIPLGPSSCTGVLVWDDRLFVSGSVGVWIFDVSQPAAPVEVGRIGTGQPTDIAVDNHLAYVLAGGMHLFDITDVTFPRCLATTAAMGDGIAVVDGVGYIAGNEFQVITAPCAPTDTVDPVTDSNGLSVRAWPNPARGVVALALEPAGSSVLGFHIYDVAGRVVRTLRSDRVSDRRVIQWDGLDDRGRQAPAGVYIVRLQSAQGFATTRITAVR